MRLIRKEIKVYEAYLSVGTEIDLVHGRDLISLFIPNVEHDIYEVNGVEEEYFSPEAGRVIEVAIEKFIPGYFKPGHFKPKNFAEKPC